MSDVTANPAIIFHNVRKSFQIRHAQTMKQVLTSLLKGKPRTEEFNALDGISFEVFPGESVAVLGHNGSGKSTTLKLLSGVMRPTAGWVRTRGRIAGLLEVGAGFHPELTGRENVYLNAAILGMSKEETDARFDDIVEFAEIGRFIDTEVKRYSSGMYARLGFAVAIHTELDVLLVDEVLSVGDQKFREKCNVRMAEMQAKGKTMFIVSHNPAQVKKLCQRGILLEHGKVIFDGPIDEAVAKLQGKNPPAGVTVIDGVSYRKLSEGGVALHKIPKDLSWPVLKLKPMVQDQPLVEIGGNSCAKSSLQAVSIPEPVRTIGRGAFFACKELTRVELPASLEEIGIGAFRDCTSLEEVVIPEGVTVIRTRAFRACSSLRRFRFPRTLQTLELGAFTGCVNLMFECYEGSEAAKILAKRVPKHRLVVISDSVEPAESGAVPAAK